MIHPPRIELARLPTPLVPLDRLSAEVGGPRIWLKRDDLTDMTASGNKLRKLEFSVAQALEEDATVLITCGGVQSNHCRATAVVASQLGLKCQLLLRGKPVEGAADGNLMLDQLLGAEIDYITVDQWNNIDPVFDEVSARWRERGEKPFCIPTGASDEIGLWGYINAAGELKSDFADHDIDPGYIVSATGSGGTLGGLVVGRELEEMSTEIVSFNVCDDEAYFVNKVSADIARWEQRYDFWLGNTPPITLIDGYVGPGYALADSHVYDTIKRLARLEGVILDPVYTGKAFDAMLTEIGKGRFSGTDDIVFMHTGGLFGLFPHRGNL